MTLVIMCCVSLSFLAWVLVLKAEVDSLKKEVEKLRSALKLDVRTAKADDIAVSGKSPIKRR